MFNKGCFEAKDVKQDDSSLCGVKFHKNVLFRVVVKEDDFRYFPYVRITIGPDNELNSEDFSFDRCLESNMIDPKASVSLKDLLEAETALTYELCLHFSAQITERGKLSFEYEPEEKSIRFILKIGRDELMTESISIGGGFVRDNFVEKIVSRRQKQVG